MVEDVTIRGMFSLSRGGQFFKGGLEPWRKLWYMQNNSVAALLNFLATADHVEIYVLIKTTSQVR